MKRFPYVHKKFLLGLLVFGVCTIIFGIALFQNPQPLKNWLLFGAALAFLTMHVWLVWIYSKHKGPPPPPNERIKIIFEERQIRFAPKYYYKHSSIARSKCIPVDAIDEVNLKTAPPSLVINGNEVLFISALYREELENFVKKNQLPLVDRFDIWGAINEPFLDTEHSSEYLEKVAQSLEANGLSREETAAIRKRIKKTMLSSNAFHWEWVHLGHMDYLDWTMLTEKKYWWSMEIALRNFHKKY